MSEINPSNTSYDFDFNILSRINFGSESESNNESELNFISFNNINSNLYEGRNIFPDFKSISNINSNYMHINDSNQSLIDKNKILSGPLSLNVYGGKDICNESKFNFIELNKEEDPFKSSQIICINSYSGENINIVNNNLSSMNNEMSDYSKKNNKNNEISLTGKKRKFSEEKNKNNFSIFTPSEENDDLRRFINNCSSKNSNTISEQKRLDSLNKKETPKKQKNTRKYDSDLIRKKIKKRFLKDLKYNVNKNLKLEGCKKQFKYFPPLFADNLTKEINKYFLNKTLKDLFSTDLIKFMEDKNIKIEDTNKSNYEKNISVLNTLKRNPKKYKNKFDFFNMTYFQLYNEYLASKEFEISIDDFKKEGEDEEYIKKYINEANNLMTYFIK